MAATLLSFRSLDSWSMCKPLTIGIIAIASLLACHSANAQISRPTLYRPQLFDVQHYDVDVRLPDPAKRLIEGKVETRISWTSRAENGEYMFHLRGLSIDSVIVEGKPREWKTYGVPADDTMHHRVVVPGMHDSGSVSRVSIFYRGTMTNEGGSSPWGGVQYDDSVLYALGVGFANASVGATQYWMPCYDHPSDKVTFTGRFTVPDSSWLVASNGLESPMARNVNGSVTYTWNEQRPIATYLLTFAAARFRTFSLAGRVPHVFYVLRRDSVVSAKSYRLVPRMTDVYSALYGAYPFDKVGYYNSLKGSMEHQGMIALALSVAKSGDSANVTAAHELAHQWFGDCLSPRDFRYAWLTESFATYSECSWLEALRGWAAYLSAVQSKARSYITQISKSEGVFALEDFPRVAPSSNYPGTIYAKGAVVLAMARALAGDSAFYSALRKYVAKHSYSTVVTEDFRAAMAPALGDRTDAFFAEWITGIGWPKLNVDQVSENGVVQVTISQVQRQTNPTWPIFSTLPLNVLYTRSRDGSAIVDTIDAVMYPDSDGIVRFSCRQLLGVNAGGLVRSLVEIARTTSVSSDNTLHAVTYTLAPQPASDDVVIQRSDASMAAKVQIVDLRGVVQTEIAFGQGASQLPVGLTDLPSGAYCVLISWSGSQIALPMLVTRGE
ncbi:MAG: M1 family metallopeptidase [Candidatus Kapabacteria bacterium]|nr:M1 family metallopeptidase [Candidatus Kapabacteria bacterium]